MPVCLLSCLTVCKLTWFENFDSEARGKFVQHLFVTFFAASFFCLKGKRLSETIQERNFRCSLVISVSYQPIVSPRQEQTISRVYDVSLWAITSTQRRVNMHPRYTVLLYEDRWIHPDMALLTEKAYWGACWTEATAASAWSCPTCTIFSPADDKRLLRSPDGARSNRVLAPSPNFDGLSCSCKTPIERNQTPCISLDTSSKTGSTEVKETYYRNKREKVDAVLPLALTHKQNYMKRGIGVIVSRELPQIPRRIIVLAQRVLFQTRLMVICLCYLSTSRRSFSRA